MHLFKSRGMVSWPRSLIAIIWIAGLVFGCFLAPDNSRHFVILRLQQRPSAIILIVLMAIPLAVSFLAIKLNVSVLLYPIAFIKAAGFAFCALCLASSFGSAGWLLYHFYIFSDSCCVVFLIWFWNRSLDENCTCLTRHFVQCLFAIIVVCFADYLLVSPFAVSLFNN